MYLDANDEEYLEYFKWKSQFSLYMRDAYCQLCEKLHNPIEKKTYQDLRQWWLFDEKNLPFCDDGSNRKYFKSIIKEK